MKKLVYCVLMFLFLPGIGKSQLLEEVTKNEEVFTIVENMPEFPGGQDELFVFLGNHTKYPAEAKANGIQGKVYVNFTVGKDGLIRDIKVIKGVHPLLDAEAVRVVGVMPLWKPGTQRGKNVNVAYNLPFNFKLNLPTEDTDAEGEKNKEKGSENLEEKDKNSKDKKGTPKSEEKTKGTATIIS